LACDQKILELIEHDERRHLVALVQRLGKVEQAVEHRLGSLCLW
jgi:hypothetical protein